MSTPAAAQPTFQFSTNETAAEEKKSIPYPELSKIFNTTIVQAQSKSAEGNQFQDLSSLVSSDAFKSILEAVHAHAQRQGVSLEEATLEVISVFQKVDSIWKTYLIEQGIQKIRSGS